MNIILIFLVGILMGAFNFAFYLYGVHVGQKKTEDAVTVDDTNKEAFKQLMEWQSYGGNK